MNGAMEPELSLATRGEDIESSLLAGERALSDEGDLQAARRWFDAAYQEADRQDDGPALARAALGLGGLWVYEHRTAANAAMVRTRQRHALSLIDPLSSLALRLRARMAAEDDYRTGGHDLILGLVTEARQAGDSVALAEALSLAHNCVLGPEHERLRLELAEELIGEASRTMRRRDLVMGLMWRTVDLFKAADPHAERSLAEVRELLAHDRHLAVGFVISTIEVMLGIRSGRLAEAEALASVCAERGEAAGDIDAIGWYGGQLAAIRWYQGRIAELVPLLSELVNSPTLSPVDNSYFAGLAVAAATEGDHRLAAGALARLRGRDLADLPRGSSWLTSMYGVVEAAHLLADATASAEAYELLAPFARLPMVVGIGVACFGSVHHALGVASTTTGDVDRAVEHLRAAVRDNLTLGHWPAVVLSRWRLGQALSLRDGPRDTAAQRELDRAAREAASLGMVLPTDGRPGPTNLSASFDAGERSPAVVTCHRRGRRWHVELNGRSVLVDDTIGMRHLATLIANPGRDISSTDLAAGSALPGTAAEAVSVSAQPVLDDLARRQYKQRLTRLQDEIDELESMNDLERATALRDERDWLIAELAAATGLGGRARRFTDGEERARIAVGKAIRRAVDRIAKADRLIGDELRTTVQTGLRCSYRPQ
ncbi:hypothetical protein ACQEVF_49170 [Nonomuraea polychroma]|uniref:hypothetical protein n=1 Tax=Nonomuraea polychroma TaxID=46176 RepID=UPI003D8E8B81